MCNCQKKKWILIGLILTLLIALGLILTPGQDTPPAETTLPTETTTPLQTEPPATEPPQTDPPETTAHPETEPPFALLFPEDLELTVPADLPEALGKAPSEVQEWFFDFAIRYRLDYMTVFTEEAGPPTDSGEYLYWVSAVIFEERGDMDHIMLASDVEEMAARYFDVSVVDHRSHFKSWTYHPDTGAYTPWPEGGRSHPLCLLRGLDYDAENHIVTVWAESYDYIHHYGNTEVPPLRDALLYGDKTDLSVRYQVIVKFRLNPETQEPLFLAHESIDVMYPYRN